MTVIRAFNIFFHSKSSPSPSFWNIREYRYYFLKPNKFFPRLDVDLLPLKLFNIKHLPYAQHGTGDTEKVTDKFLALGKKKQKHNFLPF